MSYNKETLHVINLLGGSYPAAIEGREYFRDLVQKHQGKIHVLTHPFFHEEDMTKHFYPRSEGYTHRRDVFINACLKHEVPLVIFEQFKDIDKLPQRISRGGALFRVATEDGKGRLFNHYQQLPVLVRIFKDAGVKHIISGGQNMVFDRIPEPDPDRDPDHYRYILELNSLRNTTKHTKSWLEKDIYPVECAGYISRLMAISGFEVTLSPIASPYNYWDIVKNMYNRKQKTSV